MNRVEIMTEKMQKYELAIFKLLIGFDRKTIERVLEQLQNVWFEAESSGFKRGREHDNGVR